MDLDATSVQTFRCATLPTIGTALPAGGMPAIALSFNEVIMATIAEEQQ